MKKIVVAPHDLLVVALLDLVLAVLFRPLSVQLCMCIDIYIYIYDVYIYIYRYAYI